MFDTGLYYLQSRYYDPEIGRFINADVFVSTDIPGPLSANMYAYCENNPVNASDPSGEMANWAIGAIVGGLIGGVSAAMRGGSVTDVLKATIVGAATGGLCSLGLGGVLAGSAVNGCYTILTAEGAPEGKLLKGAIACGSTLFWGSFGSDLARVAGDGPLENFIFDIMFGSVAEIVSIAFQNEVPERHEKLVPRQVRYEYNFDADYTMTGALVL